METSHNLTFYIRNMNDDRTRPVVLPQYEPSVRWSTVADHPGVDVFALNEITHDSLPIMSNLFQRGYKCATMAYAPDQIPNNSHYHFIAVKDHVRFPIVHMKWFTSTPTSPKDHLSRGCDPLLCTYEERFEKGVLFAYFEDQNVLLALVHFALYRYRKQLQYADKCAEMLVTWCNEFRDLYPNVTIITGSDFNVFPCSTHMNVLYKVLYDLTPQINTFMSYPWDFGLGRTYEQTQQILKAKEALASYTTAQSYINHCKRSMQLIWDGPLKGRLDRILSTHLLEVIPIDNFDKLTVDDYSETPFAISDHIGFLVIVAK